MPESRKVRRVEAARLARCDSEDYGGCQLTPQTTVPNPNSCDGLLTPKKTRNDSFALEKEKENETPFARRSWRAIHM